MSNTNTGLQKPSIKTFFEADNVKGKFEELMGSKTKSSNFITSVLQVAASNDLLKKADPGTVYHAAITAATIELPINNQLGFAYIVPFNNSKKGIVEAQFMIGYKGLIQLALRSGQFKTISATPIYEGQLIAENPLTGFEFDFTVKGKGKPIGFASYFKLINGFEKTMYASIQEVEKHASKYSQTFKKGFGIWKDDFESMAQKTVLKLLLSKYAPLSIEMQKAIQVDQSVINDESATDITYVDNEAVEVTQEEIETSRLLKLIENAKTLKELEGYEKDLKTKEEKDLFDARGKYFLDGGK